MDSRELGVMSMERILIIGSNGAGKSTFSYALSEQTGLPLVHIDKLYWRNHWEVTPREEFERLVLEEVQKPRWIIEGNNIRSLPERLQYADTVFWFEFSPLRCVVNVLKREFRYRGKVRPDMPDGCVSKPSLKFLEAVWQFNRKNRERITEALRAADHVRVIRFTNYTQIRKYIDKNSQ